MFSSVLIANRGEIACRIMRTAKRMGLRTIAVYSEADSGALHVREADEAYLIGRAPARDSYLDIAGVIGAAAKSRAQCIHPGYGFLSENPDFADACKKSGVVFVGPTSEAIRAMGHKDTAKRLMSEARIPVVPGYQGTYQKERKLAEAADEIGYPIMIKAVAGGGGKGMRRVDRRSDFAEALASCRREAKAAFGNDSMLIEKFISDPRHIEVQIIADSLGNCIHLYERDCSLQRRHQKVIEEAPAPKLSAGLRERMCEAAVNAARTVGYIGAGTVEFIAATGADGQIEDFYFMEMNTRLQVEHTVSEMITGLDLVELQLRVAAGEPLPFTQSDIQPKGHAIEARLYAENPASGFLPQTGTLHILTWPHDRQNLRIDTGVEQGNAITAYYDPMIAKLIAWGSSRAAAKARLHDALQDTVVLGLTSNLAFLDRIITHEGFAQGGQTTGFIDAHIAELAGDILPPDAIAAAAEAWSGHAAAANVSCGPAWNDISGWSLAGLPRKDISAIIANGIPLTVEVAYEPEGRHVAAMTGDGTHIPANGRRARASFFDNDSRTLFVAAGLTHCILRAEDVLGRTSTAKEGAAIIHAPMPGRVIAVLVEPNQSVVSGQPLVIVDAMKMEHTLKAGLNGIVKRLPVSAGSQVKEDDVLCVLEPNP